MQMPSVSRVVRLVLVMVVLGLLAYLARPWVALGWYAMQLSSMPPPAALAMPVEGVRSRGLADTWNAPRSQGRRHEGIDIFAKRGTPVLSSTEGIVLRVGESGLGGNVVWVLGPAGHRHYYAHLDEFAPLQRGQRVEAGTQLGTVGKTGNARTTPPHLHYGVYTDEGAVNPYPLLTGKRAKGGESRQAEPVGVK
jgi:murein DD-endopeptidase MepM/ murein hydrolase activator NlpD